MYKQTRAQAMPPAETAHHALLRRLEQRARDVSASSCAAPAALFGALADAEEQHAREYAGLPIAIPSDVNDAARRVAPELARVSLAFEQFVAATAATNARVAPALRAAVAEELDELKRQHENRVALLLAELDEVLEKEHAFDVACQGLRAAADAVEPTESANTEGQEQSQSEEHEVAASRARQLQRKRNVERRAIAKIVEQLRGEDTRRVVALGQRTVDALAAYSALVTASRRRVAELRDELRIGHERDIKNRESRGPENNQSDQERGGAESDDPDGDAEQQVRAAETCEVFVAMLNWMNDIFERMAPMEEVVVQRLRKMERSHKSTRLMVTTTSYEDAADSSHSKEPESAVGVLEISKLLGELAEYHHMRTVNLLDPISRTLKFTRRKLSSTHRELFGALNDTQRRVSRARSKLEARCARLPTHDAHDWLYAVTAASDSKAHSGEGLATNLTNFAMRGAANSKTTRVPRSSLTVTASLSSEWSTVLDDLDDDNNSASVDREDNDEESDDAASELSPVEKQTCDVNGGAATDSESEGRAEVAKLSSKDVDKVVAALDHYRALHCQQSEQRVDMIRSLRSTTTLAVSTMELMIQDHCKHLDAALLALENALQRVSVARADPAASSSNSKRSDGLEPLLEELLRTYDPDEREANDERVECGVIVNTQVPALAPTSQKLQSVSFDAERWIQVLSTMRELLREWWVSELKSGGCRIVWPCWLILAALLLVRICIHVASLEMIMAETSSLQRENGDDLLRLTAMLRRIV